MSGRDPKSRSFKATGPPAEMDYDAPRVKNPLCRYCRNETVFGARFCHWCGKEQERRLDDHRHKVCHSCGAGLVKEAAYCAWCGENVGIEIEGGLPCIEGYLYDWTCASCGGNLIYTMDYCPSCGKPVSLTLPKEEQCRHCGRFYHPGQYYCACCGGYLDPWIFMPHEKVHVQISADALFLLCLAAAERFYEGWGAKGKGPGFEAIGLVLGQKKRGIYHVKAIHPFASATVGPDSATGKMYFDSAAKLSALCGSPLSCLGTFHSHVNGDPRPSERDLPNIAADHLDLIVGVSPGKRKRDWEFSTNTFGLEGTVGGLKFSVGAYTRDKGGVVRSVTVELEA